MSAAIKLPTRFYRLLWTDGTATDCASYEVTLDARLGRGRWTTHEWSILNDEGDVVGEIEEHER
jgi:hypothetical protein